MYIKIFPIRECRAMVVLGVYSSLDPSSSASHCSVHFKLGVIIDLTLCNYLYKFIFLSKPSIVNNEKYV